MTNLHFIEPKKFTANIIVSALILNADQKIKLNELIPNNTHGIVINHEKNGLTHIYSLDAVDANACVLSLTDALKLVLKPKQFARIVKQYYGEKNTFMFEVNDFSPLITLPSVVSINDNFADSIEHEFVADVDLYLNDLTDITSQIPQSQQNKILGLAGIREWSESTVESLCGTTFFKINDANLETLKSYFESELWDWGNEGNQHLVAFHHTQINGTTYTSITGNLDSHAILDFTYAEDNDIEIEELPEQIELIDLLKELAEPKQNIYLTCLVLRNQETHYSTEKFEI